MLFTDTPGPPRDKVRFGVSEAVLIGGEVYSLDACFPKKYIAQNIKMTPKDHPIIPEYGNESFITVPTKGPKPLKPIHPAPIILFLGILFN
jgi:hypothetical protein